MRSEPGAPCGAEQSAHAVGPKAPMPGDPHRIEPLPQVPREHSGGMTATTVFSVELQCLACGREYKRGVRHAASASSSLDWPLFQRSLELRALELTGDSGGVVESHHAGFEDPTGLQAEWAEAGHVGKQGRASADDDWIDTDVVVVHQAVTDQGAR